MNFGGMGAVMMKKVMKQQQRDVLWRSLIATAREQGVKMVACTMSMDVMGFVPKSWSTGWSSPAWLAIWAKPTKPTSTCSYSN